MKCAIDGKASPATTTAVIAATAATGATGNHKSFRPFTTGSGLPRSRRERPTTRAGVLTVLYVEGATAGSAARQTAGTTTDRTWSPWLASSPTRRTGRSTTTATTTGRHHHRHIPRGTVQHEQRRRTTAITTIVTTIAGTTPSTETTPRIHTNLERLRRRHADLRSDLVARTTGRLR